MFLEVKNKIINPNRVLNLLYIDDLITLLINLIKTKNNKIKIISKYNKIKKISVQNILNLILRFESKRNSNKIHNFNNEFVKTFIQRLFLFCRKKIKYKLLDHKDDRGSFTEFIKTNNNGQFSIFKAKKNKIRGHHFHHSKVEKFLVVNGKAKFYMKDISSNKKIEYLLNYKVPEVIETIPGWQHYIKNIGKDELTVLLWSNEAYNEKKPDTYRI